MLVKHISKCIQLEQFTMWDSIKKIYMQLRVNVSKPYVNVGIIIVKFSSVST